MNNWLAASLFVLIVLLLWSMWNWKQALNDYEELYSISLSICEHNEEMLCDLILATSRTQHLESVLQERESHPLQHFRPLFDSGGMLFPGAPFELTDDELTEEFGEVDRTDEDG